MDSLCLLEDLCKLGKEVDTRVTTMVEASSFSEVETHHSTCAA